MTHYERHSYCPQNVRRHELPMSLRWVNSAGGPLICGEPSTAAQWKGTSRSEIDVPSDYERACAQTDFLSAMRIADREVLVLGDEPMRSAFHHGDTGLLIVRWISGQSTGAVAQGLSLVPSTLPRLQADVGFTSHEGQVMLFDAAACWPGEATSSAMPMAAGRFSVTSERYEREGLFDLIVHRFVQDGSS
jgi:hypothetical protein